MPDEPHAPEPEMPEQAGEPTHEEVAPPEPMAAEAPKSAMRLGDFSTGEGMVALAGMIILAVWLIFEVITDDYGLSHLAIVLAATAVILPRVNRAKVEEFHPLSSLMKVMGYALALIGVSEIVSDLETGFYSDAMSVLAALIAYAAFVLAFIGARSIKT